MNSFLETIKSYPNRISYSNDVEFRATLRKIFDFDLTQYYQYEDEQCSQSHLDETTLDELWYDGQTMSKNMDILLELTTKYAIFNDLYLKAAARMFSTDIGIGLAVVCSYDTFHWYYACIWKLLHTGVEGLSSSEDYKQLISFFS